MALAKTVTKLWPILGGDGRTYTVGIHLVLTDDSVTKIDADFSAPYGGAGQLAEARNRVTAHAQAAIDKYKAEKALYGQTAYTNAVTTIDTNLIL